MENKIKNIEFLRFVLAEILVLFHLKGFLFGVYSFIPEYQYMNTAIVNGEQVVDFFFIISGFFLVYTLKDISTFDYIKKKIARLFPTMAFVAILYWLESTLGYTQFNFFNTVLSDLFMFNSTGLVTTKGSMTAVWFICVLFWVSIFYFYLIRYFEKKYVYLSIALISWISYTLIIQDGHGSLNGNSITVMYSFISRGLIRGLGNMGLGCLIAFFYLKYMKNDKRQRNVYIYSFIETILFLYLFSHMSFYKNPINDDLIYIVLFCILFILFLCHRGIISTMLENNYSLLLGKYSFCLFISHGLLLKLIHHIFSPYFIERHFIFVPIIILFFCSLFAIILHHWIEIPGAKLMSKWLFSEELYSEPCIKSNNSKDITHEKQNKKY